MGNKYNGFKLFLKSNSYDVWVENKESADTTKCGKESYYITTNSCTRKCSSQVKEGKRLKILQTNY